MDLLSAFAGLFDLLVPPKDARGKRWHRIGCFVTLCFAVVALFLISLVCLWGRR
jgi:hypothetical protein